MSNEDQIEELKRLVEEERAEKRARMARTVRETRHRRMAREPEYKDYLNKLRLKNKLQALEHKAGRPKPDHCEVCSNGGKIVWDHCHNSDKFRGWICDDCNMVLGRVDDDPVRLEKLAVYLRTHNG
jgi:hypothetical protein